MWQGPREIAVQHSPVIRSRISAQRSAIARLRSGWHTESLLTPARSYSLAAMVASLLHSFTRSLTHRGATRR
jgi:hypothetical protein